jgi:hypothetical protein
VTIQPKAGSSFEITAPAGALTVAPGDSAAVEVRLKPQAQPGSISETLTVKADGGITSSVALSATIVTSVVAIEPEISFGVRPQTGFYDQSLSIRNSGSNPLRIDSASISSNRNGTAGDYFRIVSAMPVVIPPGADLTLPVRFTPSGPGEYGGQLVLYTNSPADSAITIALHATVASGSAGVGSTEAVTGGAILSLRPIAPNPAHGVIDLAFRVDSAGVQPLLLVVTDLRGATLATLFNAPTEGGSEQHVQFDTDKLPSGRYYVLLKGGRDVTARELVITR